MNALELLKQDHQKVARLFEQAEQVGDHKQKQRLFEQIKTELEIHTRIEESIFYPALEQQEELKSLVLEAYREHDQVKTLLQETAAIAGSGGNLDANLMEIKENVEHHVDEEENEMFPQVEEIMSQSELEQMGRELEQAKRGQSRVARS